MRNCLAFSNYERYIMSIKFEGGYDHETGRNQQQTNYCDRGRNRKTSSLIIMMLDSDN